jgi:streptogramin lyase
MATLPAGGPPGALTVAPDGTASVGTDAPASSSAPAEVLRWNALGALQQTAEVPEQPATRTRGVTALDQLADGSLIVADAATARMLKFDPAAASWSVLARLPDLVTCVLPTVTPCQPGLEDTPPLPRGMAIDQAGAAYIADAGQGTIWRLPPGKPIEVWYQSADIAGVNGVAGLAFDADGHLLAAVTSIADVMGPGAGALLRIERAADGTAWTRTVVTAFKAGEDPVDVAVAASGNLYVPLRGADALVVLDRQGVESLRVVEDVLKGPTAVDIALGRVLVTATGPRAAVLEIGVVDRPVGKRS